MSAKWLRVESDFVSHPKVGRLAARLGGNEEAAIAYVLRTWSWLSRFCPAGQVRDIDGTSLESACGWRGEPGMLLSHLVAAEFLDALPGGGWEAHDWADHQGKVAAKAEKEKERKRAYRAKASADRPRDNGGTSAGRPAQRDVTGRDVTYVEPAAPARPELALVSDDTSPLESPLKAAWNETAGAAGCPRWVETPEARAAAADKALKRRPLEQWVRVFQAIAADPFANGKDPKAGGWVADVDYAMRPGGRKPEPALKYLERATGAPVTVPREHRPSRSL